MKARPYGSRNLCYDRFMEHTIEPIADYRRPTSRRAIEAELGFDKERTVAVHRLLPLIALLAGGWFLLFVERSDPRTWLAPLGLLGAVGLAYVQLKQHYRRAIMVLVLAVPLALGSTVLLLDSGLLLVLLCLPASIAMAFLGQRWGWGSAVGASLLILGLPAERELAQAALLLLWCSVWLTWLANRPLLVLMNWAWEFLQQLEAQVEALRLSRAELSRTLSSLDHAYDRLQQANYDLERARQAAEEARRFKAEFAANVSHELRTPLNLILGFSEVIVLSPESYESPLPPAYRGDIEAIYRSARYLSSLVDDVLDLSGIEASRMALLVEQIDLAELVQQARATVSALYEDRGLYLRCDLPNAPLHIKGDPTRLRQVLINLLNNAARFTAQGGVEIRLEQAEHEVRLAVADTGIGIPADKLARVFDEFEQLGAQTHRRYGGSGLGLAISKQFVELHGGRIWAESLPGAGATFYVALPYEQPVRPGPNPLAAVTSWASPGARQPSALPMVLVFDDDPATVRLLQRYLDNYQVLPADPAAPPNQRPAAVLLNSHTAARPEPQLAELQARYPQVPLFVCTLPTRLDQQRAMQADAYLLKPVNREQLVTSINRLDPAIKSVLVIDDDPEFVRLIGLMLAAGPQQFRVAQAERGAAGLAEMRKQRPDLVILDLLMPEMDGYTVLAQIRADPALATTPVMILSARGHEQESVRIEQVSLLRSDGLSLGEFVAVLQQTMQGLGGSLAAPGSADCFASAPRFSTTSD
jgi:signal transduction histidine kinase/CheY-like chemotaxis protein